MNSHININLTQKLPDRSAVIDWYQRQVAMLKKSQQRLLVTWQGQREWCLSGLPPESQFADSILISNQRGFSFQQQQGVAFSKAENLLGRQTDCVIYDAFHGINIDVLCMASGLVKAGGMLILLIPQDFQRINDVYGQWQGETRSNHFFTQYLLESLNQSMPVFNQQSAARLPPIKTLDFSEPAEFIDTLTCSQFDVFQDMQSWLTNQQKAIFVLTADRGRGKSTLLGYFAEQHAKEFCMVVTSASKSQVVQLFEQVNTRSDNIAFIAPDEIIRRQQPVSLLIVDEAAMLPVGMLQQCMKLAARTVISTTIGGYEGTGQGFLLKFMANLSTENMVYRQLHGAVRWGQQDYLEKWMDQTLMLKIPAQKLNDVVQTQGITVQVYTKKQISNDRVLLQTVYALLVSAHYRTRPSDLRQLMDDQSQQVLIASNGSTIIGVLLLCREGGFEPALCEQIFLGNRRPQGHLFAQILTAQAGIRDFAVLTGLRVQRIAVHERYRRQGVGRLLLESAEQQCKALNYSYLASSFAIDSVIMPFWKKTGFSLVHISAGKGRATGRQAIAVIKSVDPKVQKIMVSLNRKIVNYLPVWLLTYCQWLNWQEVYGLLQLLTLNIDLSELDEDEIYAFSKGYRGFDLTQAVLQKLLVGELVKINFSESEVQLLIEKILLNIDWVKLSGNCGKRENLKKIRQSILQINEQRNRNE